MLKFIFEGLRAAVPLITAVASVVIAMLAFIYTARTYAVSHRPFVGVVNVLPTLVGNPPTALRWFIILKNVGSVPTLMTVEENTSRITVQGETTVVPMDAMTDKPSFFLLPGQEGQLSGQVGGNAALIESLLSGQSRLDVYVRLGPVKK